MLAASIPMTTCICRLLAVLCLLLTACSDRAAVSFYFWKTEFVLGNAEQKALYQNKVHRLYVRYFDVGMKNGAPVPLGVLHADSFPKDVAIIPVVYVKNEVFRKPHDSLAMVVLQLVDGVSRKAGTAPQEIQFDCDWTEATGAAYFHFLKQFRQLSGRAISATIRLHQVKYQLRTGIPPVDRGVLMYYNMGKIGDEVNSIYDRKTAARYTRYLSSYPLPLDVALPIFSWSILLRNHKVAGLLNKTDDAYFEKDSNFIRIRKGHYRAKHSLFKGGYYLRQGDEVKTEQIDEDMLQDMAKDLRTYLKKPIGEVIYYDLDAPNIKRYDETVFKKLAGSFH